MFCGVGFALVRHVLWGGVFICEACFACKECLSGQLFYCWGGLSEFESLVATFLVCLNKLSNMNFIVRNVGSVSPDSHDF